MIQKINSLEQEKRNPDQHSPKSLTTDQEPCEAFFFIWGNPPWASIVTELHNLVCRCKKLWRWHCVTNIAAENTSLAGWFSLHRVWSKWLFPLQHFEMNFIHGGIHPTENTGQTLWTGKHYHKCCSEMCCNEHTYRVLWIHAGHSPFQCVFIKHNVTVRILFDLVTVIPSQSKTKINSTVWSKRLQFTQLLTFAMHTPLKCFSSF